MVGRDAGELDRTGERSGGEDEQEEDKVDRDRNAKGEGGCTTSRRCGGPVVVREEWGMQWSEMHSLWEVSELWGSAGRDAGEGGI